MKKKKMKKKKQQREGQKLLFSLAVFGVVTSLVFSIVYIGSIYLSFNNISKRLVKSSVENNQWNVIDASFKESATYLGSHCSGACHLSPKNSKDILIKYNGDIIVSGDIDAGGHHFTNKINKDIDIEPGRYTVKLESFDSYTGREDASHSNQSQEQYYVSFKNGNNIIAKTGTTKDLKDGVSEAGDIAFVNTANNPIVLGKKVNKITVQHAGNYSNNGDSGKMSGFEPVCMLLEKIDEPKKEKPKKEKPKKEKPDCNSSIGDYIWYDTNGNGRQDDIEEGIENIKVCAYKDDKKYCDTTDKKGKYKIKNLCKGNYSVKVKGTKSMTQTYDPDNKKDNKTKVKIKNHDKYNKADFGYRGKAPSTGLTANVVLLIGLSVLITVGVLLVMKKKGNI